MLYKTSKYENYYLILIRKLLSNYRDRHNAINRASGFHSSLAQTGIQLIHGPENFHNLDIIYQWYIFYIWKRLVLIIKQELLA